MATQRTISPRHRLRNGVVTLSHRIGLPFGPMHLLTVPGRKSGAPRTTPVAPVVVDGTYYLLQAYPGADWVKNARAAGRGTLTRGRRSWAVRLTELPEPERGPVLREFPVQNPRGVGAFVRNGLVRSGTPDGFAEAADRCPVFRATPADGS
ncbi:nitroreductase family deazaflavin-dependent oxidoreductase [Streptomyces sp. NPDC001848]|uniref:nitroreductase family deazaflavin-dependent oxidoreductase n=1 Tax=Streptomyces sp. NPDC001848 TaxID=3364618 RepID=UPI003673D6C4